MKSVFFPAFVLRVFLISVIPASAINLHAQNCTQLAEYRDNELFNEYEKAFSQYTLNQDNRNYIKKIKDDLINDTRWSTSDAGLTIAVISQTIKTTCHLIGDLLKFHPAVGVAGTVVDNSLLSAQKVYDLIKTGKDIHSVATGGAEKTAYKLVLGKAGPLGQAVKTAWNLYENISKLTTLPADRQKLKNDVKTALERIEAEMKKYEQAIQSSTEKIKEINEIKNGIDKYLSEKC